MLILTGNSNSTFTQNVCEHLCMKLSDCTIGRFSNGEIKLDINISLRGENVYIILSPSENINEDIMEVLMIAHAAHYALAKKITLVTTCFPYARQDRKTKSRDPISARWLMDIIKASHVNHIIALDFHNGAIQGFTDIPNDNLSAIQIFAGYIKKMFNNPRHNKNDFIFVSPDAGGTKRVRDIANSLDVKMVSIYKERKEAGIISQMELLGDVKDKICIIIDDIADTCGTLCEAGKLLKKCGAIDVIAFITHGIFSGSAIEKLNESVLSTIYVTDSVKLGDKLNKSSKIKIISVSVLIALAILRCDRHKSTGPLFELDNDNLELMLTEEIEFRLRKKIN